jgi:hypothetical protein
MKELYTAVDDMVRKYEDAQKDQVFVLFIIILFSFLNIIKLLRF